MRLILPIRLAQTETTRVLGSVFFFVLYQSSARSLMSFFFFLLFLFGLARRTSLKGVGGGGGGGGGFCSKSSVERAWSVGKNENNFEGLR